jgi:hypothetical protein
MINDINIATVITTTPNNKLAQGTQANQKLFPLSLF